MLGVHELNVTDKTWTDQSTKQNGIGVLTQLCGLRHTPRSGVWPKAAMRSLVRITHRKLHQTPSKT